MLHKLSLLALLTICTFMNTAAAEGITVTVAPSARVEGAYITLGQLADISGDDEKRVTGLRQLKLGSAPSPGNSMVLSKETLGMRLAGAGSDLGGIAWHIPDTVTVTAPSQTISGQALLEKAVMTVREQTSQGDISITPIGSVRDVVAPIGDMVLTSSLPYGIRYNSPTAVMVDVSVNGQTISKISMHLDVKLYQQVVVAAVQISPGEIVTTERLRYERMDTGRLKLGYFTDVNKVQGLMTKRLLMPGAVVTDSVVSKPLLVKRGNMVTILARIGGMEVTATGKAMQDGNEGQLIRVQNVNSAKIISAKVLDASTVQVLSYKSKAY